MPQLRQRFAALRRAVLHLLDADEVACGRVLQRARHLVADGNLLRGVRFLSVVQAGEFRLASSLLTTSSATHGPRDRPSPPRGNTFHLERTTVPVGHLGASDLDLDGSPD